LARGNEFYTSLQAALHALILEDILAQTEIDADNFPAHTRPVLKNKTTIII